MQNNTHDPMDPLDMISGHDAEYVVTHPGRSQYSRVGGGVSACVLAAMNFARIVLGLHATGLGSPQLLQELMKRSLLEVSHSRHVHLVLPG